MPAPRLGDVIIRDATADTGFLVVDAHTRRVLEGPFPSFRAALVAARMIARDRPVWRENVDERGRVLGPPFLIPPVAGKTA
jgi:hypothetical protein